MRKIISPMSIVVFESVTDSKHEGDSEIFYLFKRCPSLNIMTDMIKLTPKKMLSYVYIICIYWGIYYVYIPQLKNKHQTGGLVGACPGCGSGSDPDTTMPEPSRRSGLRAHERR